MLLRERETNFAKCVGEESLQVDATENDNLELPVSECHSARRTGGPHETILRLSGCWRAIANVKMRCEQLKLCCPPARHTLYWMATKQNRGKGYVLIEAFGGLILRSIPPPETGPQIKVLASSSSA
ncbi:unnamed protein product [Toxocara canis]|uniref:Phospholipid scramblase n=1 Tax=Toxocara canis TaxID=6265 RepID=A0A183UD23_TOXCA|nr:unnamed protein product [Toxocara canis]